MVKFIAGRLLMVIPLLLFVTFLSFVLIELIPGDAATRIAGESATPEQVDAIRVELGLDRPFVERYFNWVGGAVRGDFGNSLFSDVSVLELFKQRLPATISVNLVAIGFGVAVGILTGLIAAIWAGRWPDRMITGVNSVLFAVPPFFFALVLVSLFAIRFDWFRAVGYVPLSEGVWPWFQSVALPGLSLSIVVATAVSRQLRGSMTDALTSRYVQAARASGVPRWRIIFRHAMRNAMIPTVTVIGFLIALSIGFAFVVEAAFAYKGMGDLLARAVLQQDMPVVQAGLVLVAAIVGITNVLVDLSYGWLNPKVRVQ